MKEVRLLYQSSQRFRSDAMLFEGNTEVCSSCKRVINSLDAHGEDEPICSGCAARQTQAFADTPCYFCKKNVGLGEVCYNVDDYELLAHNACVEQQSEDEQENWSDEYD